MADSLRIPVLALALMMGASAAMADDPPRPDGPKAKAPGPSKTSPRTSSRSTRGLPRTSNGSRPSASIPRPGPWKTATS